MFVDNGNAPKRVYEQNQEASDGREASALPDLLSPDEMAVIHKLSEAWNAYLNLEELHPTDRTEFMYAIHQAQRLVMARPSERQIGR